MSNPDDIRERVRAALAEDIGRGDITSELTVPYGARAVGRVVAREPVVVAGLAAGRAAFELAGEVGFEPQVEDGASVATGATVARVEGPARAVLAAERVALNLLMRLSGVATLTARYVAAVEGTGARITDTRKTTPGLRELEKAAVVAGGGTNHRAGLDDGILIKDNHLALAGGVTAAVSRAKKGAPHLLKVEVEVEDRQMLGEALAAGAEIILLDNMDPKEVAEAVRLVKSADPSILVEVSGGVGLQSIHRYAAAGPDLISVGALTHSAIAVDLSLELEPC